MKTNWNYPTSLWVGQNRVKDLSNACQNLKIKKPLFVTDKDLAGSSMVKNILSLWCILLLPNALKSIYFFEKDKS